MEAFCYAIGLGITLYSQPPLTSGRNTVENVFPFEKSLFA